MTNLVHENDYDAIAAEVSRRMSDAQTEATEAVQRERNVAFEVKQVRRRNLLRWLDTEDAQAS
ncbi:hypothetical protein C5C71_16345 [Rathayibacter sp. AY1C1]|jgi:hypothetical protein|uniref:hypothetical protein n=1 Tax=Rathayibacter sp. AY1C1 TaxID=2080534 RepID=UPI000CE8D728|nr:hypothetical protein [Rathayibacter sp. AY1C1]PPH05949.1 hypothetical protein C5C71_16345 [Rathayibacter sp. AY1C1]